MRVSRIIQTCLRRVAYSKRVPRGLLRFIDDVLLLPSMWLPGSPVRVFFNVLRGVRFGKHVWVGYGAILGNHPFLLTIGNDVIISPGVKLLTHDTSFTVVGGKDVASEIVIGSNVQIGENVVVLPGVHIGERCIIGAGAVVIKDIPAGHVAAGVPAKIIRTTAEAVLRQEEKMRSGKFFSTWKNPNGESVEEHVSPLKICILSNKNHLYANGLIRRLAEAFPADEFTIVESTVLLNRMTRIQALRKYFRVSGFHYTISQITKTFAFHFFGLLFGSVGFQKSQKYFPYTFSKLRNLKTITSCSAINDPQVISWLKKNVQPDIILSLFFNQIVRQDVIDIPKYGAFNLHPALLPKYRGISPTFWAMAQGESRTGVTLHKMSPTVDEGSIVGQKEIDILPTDSEHLLYERCVQFGFDLITDLFGKIRQGMIPESIAMDMSAGSYFSIPTKQAMREFAKRKKRLWSVTDFFISI